MPKLLLILTLSLVGIFIVDQAVKEFFLIKAETLYVTDRPSLYDAGALTLYETSCINMTLVFNKGVAFSMFAFLEESLKWLQLLLITGVLGYIIHLRQLCYAIPGGILVGAGLSNIYDRFVHGGVVDYVYWHCGFDFAIFNFADVMIDLAVVWFLIMTFWPKLCKDSQENPSV
jgi:signal peptidase II